MTLPRNRKVGNFSDTDRSLKRFDNPTSNPPSVFRNTSAAGSASSRSGLLKTKAE
jgi:hypothetical protein